ncbi:1-acyl-sn-glycerol-3-phosphate acyltransferase [Nocardioides sp. B-3]|uniref:1-acyl-sn-glycerol-3-phosphate acyltransferase n=1 Tax=Nocardioides sp. B-3 TaxID=2895565 RepID=UPI0021537988|nr:1-acyl-sn-glycerol-3-phosphate acyltransferase [Nocardioides sp. B-3]
MFFAAVHRVVPPVAKAIFRPTVTGLEHVPRSGGVISASNHLSFIDSTMIPIVVPRKVVFPGEVRLLHRHRGQGDPAADVVRGHGDAAGRP